MGQEMYIPRGAATLSPEEVAVLKKLVVKNAKSALVTDQGMMDILLGPQDQWPKEKCKYAEDSIMNLVAQAIDDRLDMHNLSDGSYSEKMQSLAELSIVRSHHAYTSAVAQIESILGEME